jgi:hypothetical protein
VVELVKAISIAELEAKGHYVEAEHDLVFEAFDAQSLTADDLARFPDYLVCIPPGRNDAPENANLLEMLSSGLPVKVLVQTTDLLEEASIGAGHFAFGVRSARLATAAMGLGGMFVLQSTSSNLYALRAQVERGLACRGPALFSVFAGTGSARPAGALPHGRSGDAVARFPGLQLRRGGRRQLGRALLAGEQPERRAGLAVETLPTCRHGPAAGDRALRLQPGRLRAV